MRFLVSEHTILPVINTDGFHEWVDAPSRKQGEAMAHVLWQGRDLILTARRPAREEE